MACRIRKVQDQLGLRRPAPATDQDRLQRALRELQKALRSGLALPEGERLVNQLLVFNAQPTGTAISRRREKGMGDAFKRERERESGSGGRGGWEGGGAETETEIGLKT